MEESPSLFRVPVEVLNIEEASKFYSTLFGIAGKDIGYGRMYFDCGSVILALVDVSHAERKLRRVPRFLNFSVSNIEMYYKRAQQLNCLLDTVIEGQRGGELVTRPWGERSFYMRDPYGNGLCFVDENTLFTEALNRE